MSAQPRTIAPVFLARLEGLFEPEALGPRAGVEGTPGTCRIQ